MTIAQLFATVRNTAGTNDKLRILSDEMSDLVKDIFEQAYGNHKFYVTMVDTETTGDRTIEEGWTDFKQLLRQCECRNITGNEARFALQMELERFQDEDQRILLNVLAHNLKIGVSRDNFQKIAPIFDVYEVSLAEQLADTKGVDPVDGTYFASRKLDGVRCVAFINNHYDEDGILHQDVEFRSRQNKVFTTLDKLKDPVRQMMSPYLGKWVLDGEVCIIDENGDEHFDWVMKEITRKDHTIAHPCYNVFDLLTQDEFDMKQESPRFEIRLFALRDLYKQHPSCFIKVLKQERLMCQEDFDRWSGYVTEGHWEGFMLRKDVPYQRGRNKDLLKVKKFKDAEYVVIGTLNSKVTYNEDGHKEFDACSALLIEHKGNQVQVGSGLSKEQRLRWYEHPEEIVGKTITVQYFEETKDSKTGEYSLRFPVLKYVYENGRSV